MPKVKDGTTPQWKPKMKKTRQAHFVGGTACGKRASGNTQRAQHMQSRAQEMHQVHRTTARPATLPEYESSRDVDDYDEKDDAETRRRQAYMSKNVAVHTPSGPQQKSVMDFSQYKVVALRAFLRRLKLSQAGKKAKLIERLKQWQDQKIRNMTEGIIEDGPHQRPQQPPPSELPPFSAPSCREEELKRDIQLQREQQSAFKEKRTTSKATSSAAASYAEQPPLQPLRVSGSSQGINF